MQEPSVPTAAEHAPGAMPSVHASGASLGQVRAAAIRATLERHRGNVAAAARSLKVSRNTVLWGVAHSANLTA